MIPIREYNSICQSFVDTIDGLDRFVLSATDKHTVNQLSTKPGITLVAVIPSSSADGKPGIRVDTNSALFFVVSKYTPGTTKKTELDQYEELQNIIIAIRDQIYSDQEDNPCSPFHRLQPNPVSIDPDFNTFGGYNGWFMTFNF